jgi:hypothetical protein
MNIATAAASVFACAFSLQAQITATLHRLDDREEISIRNESGKSLVAYAVYVKLVRESPAGGSRVPPLVMYFDALEPETTPLSPNEERVILGKGSPVCPWQESFGDAASRCF